MHEVINTLKTACMLCVAMSWTSVSWKLFCGPIIYGTYEKSIHFIHKMVYHRKDIISFGTTHGWNTSNVHASTIKLKLNVLIMPLSLQWRQNWCNGASNHRHLDCSLKRLYRRRSKKTPKLCITGRCEGNPSVKGGFPSQKACSTKYVSIWWHHHDW